MLRKITDFIVKYCYVVFVAILALAAGCAVLSTKVKINHDIYSYMPEDSETSQGLAIMEDEFDYNSTSSYQKMFEDLPESERYAVKNYIESVENVKSVDYDDSEDYNQEKDGHTYTLYAITVSAPADSTEANTAYNTIFDHFKEDYTSYENGDVFMNNGSVLKPAVTVLAIATAMLILTVMSKSYVEPWLYLFAILIAVVLNKGTNIVFSEVSHITDSISMVLQMALSMDYAIMLSSRYRQEKEKIVAENAKLALEKTSPKSAKAASAKASKFGKSADKFTAMNRALRYSFGAISSSSVTTVVGLIVLVVMSFTIGRDMGLVLSKGVVLSLFSIFTTLPALLLMSDKLVEKTKKRSLHLNLKWLGEREYNLRFLAIPLFAAVFIAAFLLKGSIAIDYTASENDRIKDVFSTVNQTALIYRNSESDRVTAFCHDYENKPDVIRVLCYGNTIGEPEKYNEIIDKVNSLQSVAGSKSAETLETEDYLVKVLYYYYYRGGETQTMTLPEFIRFVQNEVLTNEHFSSEVSADTAKNIERLANFILPEKANAKRSQSELAELLGVGSSKLDDLMVLYYSKYPHNVKLTLYQFASFVTNEVLTNPEYASLVSDSSRSDLAKLLKFSNQSVTNAKMSASELADLFGLDAETLEQLLVYYNYTTTTTPTVALTPEDLINFALTNSEIRSQIPLTDDQIAEIEEALIELKTLAADFRADMETYETEFHTQLAEKIVNLPADEQAAILELVDAEIAELNAVLDDLEARANAILTAEYTYDDYVDLVAKITHFAAQLDVYRDAVGTELAEIDETYDLDLSSIFDDLTSQLPSSLSSAVSSTLSTYLAQLKQIYILYQAENATVQLTPAELVDFLLAHASDDRLASAMNASTLSQLKLAKYIISNQSTLYGYQDLANAFNLDTEQLKLVYALYDLRHINTNPQLSPKELINFIVSEVLPNETYARHLDANQRAKIYAISELMGAAENGVQYNWNALYRALVPLTDSLDPNQLFLLYLYHGSLYDYVDSWTLTIEQFVEFLNDQILPDTRFAARIEDDVREKIIDSKDTIADARELLVGPYHSRVLIETYLSAEGVETFAFLQGIKDDLGEGNKTDYFVIGDSAMAYEMSLTFNDEMDFITILTMIAIFIVVAFTFKSILIPLLLVLVIQSAVYINMAYLSLTGSHVYFIALIIVQAILMGATIDYAILYTSYYLEHRNYFKMNIKEALIASYNKSIHAILTSASILILVTAIVGNFATAIAAKICQSISTGTLCATLIILFLLPAILAAMDKWIVKKNR